MRTIELVIRVLMSKHLACDSVCLHMGLVCSIFAGIPSGSIYAASRRRCVASSLSRVFVFLSSVIEGWLLCVWLCKYRKVREQGNAGEMFNENADVNTWIGRNFFLILFNLK